VYRFAMDRGATLLSGAAFLGFAVLEFLLLCIRRKTGFRQRFPLYVVALLIFYITVVGLKNQQFVSMIRYSLPWHVLLVLCLAHLISKAHPRLEQWARPAYLVLGVALIYLLVHFQFPELRDYLQGRWVS
jgi:hypothetical protein